jgi:hypothetical protein
MIQGGWLFRAIPYQGVYEVFPRRPVYFLCLVSLYFFLATNHIRRLDGPDAGFATGKIINHSDSPDTGVTDVGVW